MWCAGLAIGFVFNCVFRWLVPKSVMEPLLNRLGKWWETHVERGRQPRGFEVTPPKKPDGPQQPG